MERAQLDQAAGQRVDRGQRISSDFAQAITITFAMVVAIYIFCLRPAFG